MDRTHANHKLEENTISRFIFLNWDKVTSKEQNSHSDTDISKNRIIHHKKWGSNIKLRHNWRFPCNLFYNKFEIPKSGVPRPNHVFCK